MSIIKIISPTYSYHLGIIKFVKMLKKTNWFGILLCNGLILCAMISCYRARKVELILDVPKIINKSPEENIITLGKPDSIYQFESTFGFAHVHFYQQHEISIYYNQNQAREIRIHNPKPIRFDKKFIQHIGINPPNAPDYVIDSVIISWNNIPDYTEVFIMTESFEDNIHDYYITIIGK